MATPAFPLVPTWRYPQASSRDRRDPRDLWLDQILQSQEFGDLANQYFRDLPYQDWEDMYRQRSDIAYGDIAEGRGGYQPWEIDEIIRQGDLEGLGMTPEEAEDLYYTLSEQEGIRGRPGRAWDFYRPGYLSDLSAAGRDRSREALGEQERRMRESLGRTRGLYEGAIDPDRLRLDPAFRQAQMEALGGTEGRVRGAIDPTKLGLSGRFQEKFPVTDEEVARMGAQAGRIAGGRYRSAIADLERRAAAAGNVSPLAVAAGRSRYEGQSAADEADAITDALIKARREQRGGELTLEQERLGAERDISGRLTGAELELGGRRTAEQRAIEGMRLGSEQDLSNRMLERARGLGGMELDTERYLGSSRLGAESEIANRDIDVAKYLQSQGIDLARWQDMTESDRARVLADARRQTSQYVSGERYRRGLTANELLSGRHRDVAGQRRADEQEYRNYLRSSTGMFGNQAAQARNQWLQSQEMGQRGQLAGRRGYADWERYRQSKPGIFSRVMSGIQQGVGIMGSLGMLPGGSLGKVASGTPGKFLGSYGTFGAGPQGMPPIRPYAHGGIVTEPTIAMIGEEGPEAVVPLSQYPKRRRYGVGDSRNPTGESASQYSPAYQ